MTNELNLEQLQEFAARDDLDNTELKRVKLPGAGTIDLYTRSVMQPDDGYLFLSRDGRTKWLWTIGASLVDRFTGEKVGELDGNHPIKRCPIIHENAETLRDLFEWARPQLIGVQNSYGLGDRLGIANPAHLREIWKTDLNAVLAQQSIRELERTERTPDEVMDAATWAALQEGYTAGFGADADHLKTQEHIDYMVEAGFTMFTFDPGDHVVNEADELPLDQLEQHVQDLPWDVLEETADSCIGRYAGRRIEVGDELRLEPDREDVLRALTKYGKVIAHVKRMHRHLVEHHPDHPREIELSVDETDSVTQPFEHYLVVNELRRLGVGLVSLAPRFVGGFEKGIDYKGDLEEFKREYIKHLIIAEELGPYKLSVHSGSDKFSVYKAVGSLKRGHVHIKTAGTSYLEALRSIAKVQPDLFRKILDYSREIYETEKRSYHVSAAVEKVPAGEECTDAELVALFEDDQEEARQVLHVCFGRVLTDRDDAGEYRFRHRIMATLEEHEAVHYATLQSHFRRHFTPLSM